MARTATPRTRASRASTTNATTGTSTTATTGNTGGTAASRAAAAAAKAVGVKEVPQVLYDPVLLANPEMNQFLEKVAKITHPVMRYKVIVNGFDDLEELAKMEPDHAARTCTVIRRSTGSVLTKDISINQELVLKRLVQWAVITYMVGRPLDLADATAANLQLVGAYFTKVSKAKDPPDIPKFGDTSCKRKWIDAIKDHLALLKGASGLPVSYIAREEDDPPLVLEALGKPSFEEQLLSSGRHDGYYYPMDNELVYHTIKNLVLNSHAYSCIVKFEKKFDGRAAFKALERNYLGPHMAHLIQRQAEKIVNTSVFTGESRNMTLDKYNDRLKKAWHDIDICGMDKISERTKVEKYLSGFQVPGLEHARSIINNDKKLRENFIGTMEYLHDEARAKNALFSRADPTGARSVSAFTINSGHGKKGPRWNNAKKNKNGSGGGGGKSDEKTPAKGGKPKGKKDKAATAFDPNDPGKHVTSKVWRSMTEEQRTASREARANQKRSTGSATRSCKSVNLTWRRTDHDDDEPTDKVPAAVAAALRATPTVMADVEMVDAGNAGTTAGVSSALKPACVKIMATQRVPTSHRVTYSVGTKGGSTKGVKAMTEALNKATEDLTKMSVDEE